MVAIKISGQVLFQDSSPAPGANVRILDLDTGGNGNDVILQTTTDGQGRFSGLSSECDDINNQIVNIPFVGPQVVPLPDILILRFEVSDGNRNHIGPFIRVNDTISAPIVCPWMPDINLFGKVDGQPCTTSDDFHKKIEVALQQRKPTINIVLFDKRAVINLSALAIREHFRSIVAERIPNLPPLGDSTQDAILRFTLAFAFLMLVVSTKVNSLRVCLAIFSAMTVFGYHVEPHRRIEDNKDALVFELARRI